MKKILALAAFVVAFAPLAHAQDNAAQYGHPDALNNRPVEMHEHAMMRHEHHKMHHEAMHHEAHHMKKHHEMPKNK